AYHRLRHGKRHRPPKNSRRKPATAKVQSTNFRQSNKDSSLQKLRPSFWSITSAVASTTFKALFPPTRMIFVRVHPPRYKPLWPGRIGHVYFLVLYEDFSDRLF